MFWWLRCRSWLYCTLYRPTSFSQIFKEPVNTHCQLVDTISTFSSIQVHSFAIIIIFYNTKSWGPRLIFQFAAPVESFDWLTNYLKKLYSVLQSLWWSSRIINQKRESNCEYLRVYPSTLRCLLSAPSLGIVSYLHILRLTNYFRYIVSYIKNHTYMEKLRHFDLGR